MRFFSNSSRVYLQVFRSFFFNPNFLIPKQLQLGSTDGKHKNMDVPAIRLDESAEGFYPFSLAEFSLDFLRECSTAMQSLPDRPLRICLLSYRSNPYCGGQGVYVQKLSRALHSLGHRVTVVSGPPLPRLDPGIRLHDCSGLDLYNPGDLFRVPSARELTDPLNLWEWFSVSTMGFPEPFVFGIRAYRFLRRRLPQFDVFHDNQGLSYGLWAIRRRAPVVATIHHPISVDRDLAIGSVTAFWEKLKQARWYSFLGMQKRVARTMSRLITVSKRSCDDIAREFDIPRSRFRIVPNGVDTRQFRPLPGIERQPGRIVVTSSADVPLKGLRFLLEAVAALAPQRAIRLVVVGSPRKDGSLRSIIRMLGIEDRVSFTGPIDPDALVRQYAQASMAVIPSLYEGFGLPAIEAMACGLPVISTRGGALPEVVGDGGILVPPGNSRALAEAMADLYDNPDAAAKLGARGYRRARGHFTWEKTAQSTVQVYREAILDHRGSVRIATQTGRSGSRRRLRLWTPCLPCLPASERTNRRLRP